MNVNKFLAIDIPFHFTSVLRMRSQRFIFLLLDALTDHQEERGERLLFKAG